MIALTVAVNLEQVTCPGCGGVYAISAEWKAEARRLGSFKQCWTCPYCKTERGYGENVAARQQNEIERLKADATRQADELRRVREERDHHWIERKKTLTRLVNLKARVSNGVCPCCRRSFENLQRHMATKHPAYAAPVEKEGA